MQPLSSATTGVLEAVTQRRSTGGSPGTTGSTNLVSASNELARDWLLSQINPEAVDAALARSLTSTLGVTAMARVESRFPPEGGYYQVVTGYALDILDHDNIPAAILKVEQACTPATPEQCEGWLVMLQAACAHRTDSEVSSAVAYSLYAAELRRWPADVAKGACERLARGKIGQVGTNWFPTLAELVAECERLASPRKALYAALHKWAPQPPRIATPRGIREPTEEDKAAVRRMAEEAMASLRATAAAQRAPIRELPTIAGKADERGLTQEMRELMARHASEAQ